MEDIKIRFGRRLRELRLKKGWSQETMSNLAEIDRTYTPRIESGMRYLSLVEIDRLSSVFKMEISALLKGK